LIEFGIDVGVFLLHRRAHLVSTASDLVLLTE
jgi:hypothetical protein